MDLWEIAEYVGETLVFLGVVGEVCAEWAEPERKRLGKVASIVLVIGLGLSLAALIGTNEHFNGTIADLNAQAADAKERAGVANKAAEQLGKDTEGLKVEADKQRRIAAGALRKAGEANALAAKERLDEAQLELLVSPRRLTIDQQDRIGKSCKGMNAGKVIIGSYGMDSEARGLGIQIAHAIFDKTFPVSLGSGGPITSGEFDEGVLITGPPEKGDFMRCLSDALTTVGRLKQVSVNRPKHSVSMRGDATMGGNATMRDGGGIEPTQHLPPDSPVDIFVGVKPIELMQIKQ